jgi:seryl-tRNA synthetase
MLDPLILRNDLESTASALLTRGYALDTDKYASLEARRKSLQMQMEELQSERNSSAKSIGNAKGRGEDIQPLLAAVAKLGEDLKSVENQFREVRDEQAAWLLEESSQYLLSLSGKSF